MPRLPPPAPMHWRKRSAELDRERDQIMVEASRREAENARREAERLRLQALARQEEAARLAEEAEAERMARAETFALAEKAKADAEQAPPPRRHPRPRGRAGPAGGRTRQPAGGRGLGRRRPAAAPRARSAPATVYTLAGSAFASGRATLTTEANASLRRLAREIGNRSVEIVGYTDSQGAAQANLQLSQRRAEAVAAILKESGATGSIRTMGRGAADPVADNATAEGRAKNPPGRDHRALRTLVLGDGLRGLALSAAEPRHRACPLSGGRRRVGFPRGIFPLANEAGSRRSSHVRRVNPPPTSRR
ncbi:MAG: hypothetical protein KatS3mg082_2786 [Nitrospiraceae bacterium]|nr:MAG: hypothetical protein KatS3mg082_2786 [Nitrospiraceae bacterium]